MPTMKGLLFNQFAAEGLKSLVEEMQSKYTTKKGRRFNHNNVTYEVSRPSLNDGAIEYEISSKIPEDEIKGPKEMQAYFTQIKKILSKGKPKPESIEMENIVWDSKKNTEKKRDYVKLLYKLPLDDLFDDKVVANDMKTSLRVIKRLISLIRPVPSQWQGTLFSPMSAIRCTILAGIM